MPAVTKQRHFHCLACGDTLVYVGPSEPWPRPCLCGQTRWLEVEAWAVRWCDRCNAPYMLTLRVCPLCETSLPGRFVRPVGYYTDTYRRTDAGWRLATRSMTFLRRSGDRDSGRPHDPTRPEPNLRGS